MVFISSHGFMQENKLYLKAANFDVSNKERSSISYNLMMKKLNDVSCKRLVFIDACRENISLLKPSKLNDKGWGKQSTKSAEYSKEVSTYLKVSSTKAGFMIMNTVTPWMTQSVDLIM